MSTFDPTPIRPGIRRQAGLTVSTLLLLSLGACGGMPSAAASPDQSPAPRALRVVRAEALRDRASTSPLTADGTLRARRRATLSFAVDGVIAEWTFDEGQEVGAGEVLARLDPVPFETAVARAKARTDYLEKSLQRSRRLKDQKALSDEEFDGQEAEVRAARATLRLAQWRIDRSQLRAPFGGWVRRRLVESGEVVAPGAVAFEVIATDELEVDLAVAAGDLGSIDLDAAVQVVVPGVGAATGRVDHPPLESDPRSGAVLLRVVVDNAQRSLLPGLVAQVEFTSPTSAEASRVVLPLSALRIGDDGASVWRIEGGRIHRLKVQTGPVRGDWVEILAGIRAGDRVVDHAPDTLREGDALRIVDEVQR